jgi:hypothetical protein
MELITSEPNSGMIIPGKVVLFSKHTKPGGQDPSVQRIAIESVSPRMDLARAQNMKIAVKVFIVWS